MWARHFVHFQDFEELLTFIGEAIEENVERLSECGSDKMFQNLSAVFRNLFHLLSRTQTISQAEEMVRTGSFYAWSAMAYKQILPTGPIQHTTELRWWMFSSSWCLKAVACCLSCRSEATPVVTEAVACRSVLYSANLCCKF